MQICVGERVGQVGDIYCAAAGGQGGAFIPPPCRIRHHIHHPILGHLSWGYTWGDVLEAELADRPFLDSLLSLQEC